MDDLKLTVSELRTAIDHMAEAKMLVESCHESIGNCVVVGNIVLNHLHDAWYQVNCCRLYTEPSVTFEGFTLTAMGYISDAAFMMDSLIQWDKGLTVHGRLSMLNACSEALANIGVVQGELENMLSGQVNGSAFSETLLAAISV
jgi:hypothetical protein